MREPLTPLGSKFTRSKLRISQSHGENTIGDLTGCRSTSMKAEDRLIMFSRPMSGAVFLSFLLN